MNIGLIDVDGHNFPNLALMKLSAWHKTQGDTVEWYTPFGSYDIVYLSKVFSFSPEYAYPITNANKIVRGGTGYDYSILLPEDAELITPDYSIYPGIDKKTAYGFLTRGCIRSCKWCIVPKKEGSVRPYQDVDEIAADGRTNLILMDNNILAAGEYGRAQLLKIIERGYRVDFNQAMDARLVTDDIARILAQIKWLNYIRFGCDTPAQVEDCKRAVELIRLHGYKKEFMLFTMLHGDIEECYNRVSCWRGKFDWKVTVMAQPYLDPCSHQQNIPQWQRDMARWTMRKWFYKTVDFKEFEPRKGFRCKEYFK